LGSDSLGHHDSAIMDGDGGRVGPGAGTKGERLYEWAYGE
jgi:hypothetical protein